MASAAASLTEAVPAAGRAPPNRVVEFLLVGGATLILFPVLWGLRAAAGLEAAELAVGFLMFHAAFVINDPHFSVTYLLFYKNARRRAFGDEFGRWQRLRYWVAGLFVPLGLIVWAALALSSDSARSLGWMIQLMFLLVGWHYVKQGFGVLTVLSARRGVHYSAAERSVILLHCYAAWAYAWASPADLGKAVEEKGVVYTTLAHPGALETTTAAAFAASAVACFWVLGRKWQRDGALPLAPLTGLLVTVWLWTVYSSVDPLMVYAIPALHSVQYLYFVWLLERNQARAEEGPPRFGRPVGVRLGLLAASAVALGWLLFRGVPDFFDSARMLRSPGSVRASDLGATPFAAAFFVVVNLHHYFMDSVIWRRDNPETRYLMRR